MGARFSAFRLAVRRIFSESLPGAVLGKRTSRVISQQLDQAMRVMSVALIAQGAGAALLIASLWSAGSHALLISWGIVVILTIIFSIEYNHLFFADKNRVARIRGWIRVGIAHSFVTGITWGFAGAVFPSLGSEYTLAASVSAVIGVALGSWPFYAMWLPGLAIFTFLALFPTGLSILLNYFHTSQGFVAIFFFIVIGVILYSGRRLHDLILSSILTETENRKLLQKLARERNAAEAARRTAVREGQKRQEFFRAANHDLRQPLQAMAIYLQILKKKAPADIAPVVQQLSLCAGSISNLVEQILEVSRITADTLAIQRELVPIPEYFEKLRQECDPIARARGGTFVIRPLDYKIDTDPALLSRVIRNLVNNAFKYSDKEHPIVILAARRRAKGLIQICVYDNGPGISREDREKIFHSFYRGEAGRKAEGFGLGLAIVKGICSRLGIGLSMGSLPGKGSVFRLQLGASTITEPLALSPRGQVKKTIEFRDIPARILYLEDNRTVSDSVKALLESWGATVRVAPFLDDGLLEEMKTFKPQILLTDFDFGEGAPNGIESCLKLSHALKTSVPTVILTAVPEDMIEREWQKQLPHRALVEMPEILRKPADEEKLNGALWRMFEAKGPDFAAPAGSAQVSDPALKG